MTIVSVRYKFEPFTTVMFQVELF